MSIISNVLALNVEIWKRENYCILADLRRDEFEFLHPSEAYILSFLDGKIAERELAYIISAVYDISSQIAEDLVRTVLKSYASFMVDSRGNVNNITRYKSEDFLYPGFEEIGDLNCQLSAPLVITLDLTRSCNFRCRYCYYGKCLSQGSDMPENIALKIINDAADAGVVRISFGGGESLLYPGFSEIVRTVKMRRMLLSFTTNGSLLNKKMVSSLVENGIKSIGISIDSPDPRMHHFLTQSIDTFDSVISGIKELKANGFWVKTLSVKTSHNFHTASALIDLLIDLGVDAINICPYSERSCEGIKRHFNGSLSSEDKLQLALLVKEKISQYSGRLITYDTREETWQSPKNILPCYHLLWGFVVHHNGNVSPCELIEDPELSYGNLFRTSIKEVWLGQERKNFICNTMDSSIVKNECAQCQFLSKCHTGCFNLAKVVSGDHFAKDPRCPGRKIIDNPESA